MKKRNRKVKGEKKYWRQGVKCKHKSSICSREKRSRVNPKEVSRESWLKICQSF